MRTTLSVLACCTLLGSAAHAQTFDLTPDQVRAKFGAQIKADGGDGIKECHKVSGNLVCTFNDAAFQKSVAGFKKLDLANGSFSQKIGMILFLKDGKVSKIAFVGDRGDPLNLFSYFGEVATLARSLDSSLSTDDAVALMKDDLGVMRGDDDATIGKPKTAIKANFAATCLSRPSKEETAVVCTFDPRY